MNVLLAPCLFLIELDIIGLRSLLNMILRNFNLTIFFLYSLIFRTDKNQIN